MGTNKCSQPASKSSSDRQDFGDVNMVLKMAHFHKSSRSQWVNVHATFQIKLMVLEQDGYNITRHYLLAAQSVQYSHQLNCFSGATIDTLLVIPFDVLLPVICCFDESLL